KRRQPREGNHGRGTACPRLAARRRYVALGDSSTRRHRRAARAAGRRYIVNWPWSKSIARIYVSEIRDDKDKLVGPIFTPDTAIDAGDFGYFEAGRFVRKGNVTDRGLEVDIEETDHAGFDFASSGKVTIGPSAKVPNPVGGELLKASLKFSKGHAVVASFPKGKDRS